MTEAHIGASSSMSTGGTSSVRTQNQAAPVPSAAAPRSPTATAPPADAEATATMAKIRAATATTASTAKRIVTTARSRTRRRYPRHSSATVTRWPITDRLTETVSTPLRTTDARARKGMSA